MLNLLETLIAFVGVMLVLALAAQSAQELVKVMFAIKGQTALRGLKGLIEQAAKAENMPHSGQDLLTRIVDRLRGLGQNGVRPNALRLDALSAEKLTDLIVHVDPRGVAGLNTLQDDVARASLRRIAEHAEAWFSLAMDPVSDRYRRRMRGLAFVSSAVVVWALNADALTIFRQAREDKAFRDRVGVAASGLADLHGRVRALGDRCAGGGEPQPATTQPGDTTAIARDTVPSDTTKTPPDSACAALAATLDSLDTKSLLVATDSTFLAGIVGDRRYGDPIWWVGLLLSTLLVSLGAPFWHDLLEALFGLKNRVRAQAEKVEAEKPPALEVRRRIGPDDVAIVRGQADEEIK